MRNDAEDFFNEKEVDEERCERSINDLQASLDAKTRDHNTAVA